MLLMKLSFKKLHRSETGKNILSQEGKCSGNIKDKIDGTLRVSQRVPGQEPTGQVF